MRGSKKGGSARSVVGIQSNARLYCNAQTHLMCAKWHHVARRLSLKVCQELRHHICVAMRYSCFKEQAATSIRNRGPRGMCIAESYTSRQAA